MWRSRQGDNFCLHKCAQFLHISPRLCSFNLVFLNLLNLTQYCLILNYFVQYYSASVNFCLKQSIAHSICSILNNFAPFWLNFPTSTLLCPICSNSHNSAQACPILCIYGQLSSTLPSFDFFCSSCLHLLCLLNVTHFHSILLI